jgi:hypothetical protein
VRRIVGLGKRARQLQQQFQGYWRKAAEDVASIREQ